jgi:hypothetical protein
MSSPYKFHSFVFIIIEIFLCQTDASLFRDTQRLYIGFKEWFCFCEDFIRHSFSALLGGNELRPLTSILYRLSLFLCLPESLIL